MPPRAHPSGMPQEVRQVIEILGSAVRIELLRRLSIDGPATARDLAGRVGVHHSSIHRHLLKLEEIGLVVADVEAGHRRGGQTLVQWRADPAKIQAAADQWAAYATGTSD